MPSQGSSPPINLPTRDEKLALQGTSGSPSSLNRYVTDQDPRLSGFGLLTLPYQGSVAVGDLVSPAAGGLVKCDPSDTAKMPAAGMVRQIVDGSSCVVQLLGPITGLTGLTPQAVYYVGPSGTPIPSSALGDLSEGDILQAIGIAVTASTLSLSPSTYLVVKP